MIIDPTTRNKVYCPNSPQGQWFNHRFGRRDYPDINLPLEVVEAIVEPYLGLPFLAIFSSKYGDPAEWIHIRDCSNYLENWMRIETYGMSDSNTYDILSRNFTEVEMHIDGMHDLCGKVFLGASWDVLDNNIKTMRDFRRPEIVFYVYEHNKHQMIDIYNYCLDHKLNLEFRTSYDVTEPHGACVIDENKKWLYDVKPHKFPHGLELRELVRLYEDARPEPLTRHLIGYNSLRLYTKQNEPGRNILERPMLPKVEEKVEIMSHTVLKARESHIWLAPTGHKFHNGEEFSMFMNMLGREWNIGINELKTLESHSRDEYPKRVIAYGHAFTPDILEKLKVKLPEH